MIAYGMSAKTLSSTLADPMNPWTIALNEVAAATGIPATILIGQQTGRLVITSYSIHYTKLYDNLVVLIICVVVSILRIRALVTSQD